MNNAQVKAYTLHATQFDWKIAEGKTVEAWGFNEQLPGPVLKASKGDTVVVTVKNDLPEPTIVHWHGIRLPAEMDGTGEVQRPIMPGETFEYRFVVPDAGTFWYHSHYNETVQMERGMYGAIVVEDPNDPVFDKEQVLLFDDMKLDDDNEFTVAGNFFSRLKERHDGREGNTNLVNGKEQPLIHIHAGQSERWRLINASSARYILLRLNGKEFSVIANDGGLLQQAQKTTEVLITPGERVDIAVGPFEEGEEFTIESLPYNRVTFLKAKRQTYATVSVIGRRPSLTKLPHHLRTIEPLAQQHTPVSRRIKFSVGPSLKHGLDFLVNDAVHVNDAPVTLGELQVWEVRNASLMDHPFHLHGFFFQVIEENGKVPHEISWKDTYNLKPRTTIKIAWMPDRPGKWMYHCHILEHHAAGMMANFEVVDPAKPYVASFQTHSCHTS